VLGKWRVWQEALSANHLIYHAAGMSAIGILRIFS
jgi:hypothetical protein